MQISIPVEPESPIPVEPESPIPVEPESPSGGHSRVHIPDDPDVLLTRQKTAAALTEAGYPISPKTLATKATRGGGPTYRLFGPRAIYRWGDSLGWAQARLTEPRTNTSAKDVA
jgi:hypothetical protein